MKGMPTMPSVPRHMPGIGRGPGRETYARHMSPLRRGDIVSGIGATRLSADLSPLCGWQRMDV